MTDTPDFPKSLQLGLWAPTLTEQGFAPFLPDVGQYEMDDAAISRLHIRGLITHAQHIDARERLAKKIKQALAVDASSSPPQRIERPSEDQARTTAKTESGDPR